MALNNDPRKPLSQFTLADARRRKLDLLRHATPFRQQAEIIR